MTSATSIGSELARRVHGLVRAYVYRRTEERSRIPWDSFKDRKIIDQGGRERVDVPPPYREAREKVCKDVFLRIRACRAREDFVTYFTGTICSVPQYLPEAEYQLMANAIFDEDQWEEVKALAMLTLSALSRV
jgi:CRISPR-associated protein Cmx8